MDIDVIAEIINVVDIEIAGLSRLKENINSSFKEAIQAIYNCRGKVILTGMGKSGLIAKKIASTFSSLGTPAIFMHSAEGMQALMNGVPAIHLNIDAPLSCDPIMDLEVSKWTVSSPEEFSAVLQEIYSLEENQRGEAVSIARKYTEEYFTVPDEENIMRFFVDDKTL